MLWGCHFSNFKPILGQIPEFELFGSFFSLKLDNFEKLCIKNCNRNPRDGSFFEIFYEIWPIIINFFSFAISLLSLFSLQWFWNFHCFIAMNEKCNDLTSIIRTYTTIILSVKLVKSKKYVKYPTKTKITTYLQFN